MADDVDIQDPHPLFPLHERSDVKTIRLQDQEQRQLADMAPNSTQQDLLDKLAGGQFVGKFVAIAFDHKGRQCRGYVELHTTPADVERVRRESALSVARDDVGAEVMRRVQEQLTAERAALEDEKKTVAAQRAEAVRAQETAQLEMARLDREARKEAGTRLERAETQAQERMDQATERAHERAQEILDDADERARTTLEQAEADAESIRARAQMVYDAYVHEREALAKERERVRDEARDNQVQLLQQKHELTVQSMQDRVSLQIEASKKESAIELAKLRQEMEAQLPSKKVREEREMRQLDHDLPPRSRLDDFIDGAEKLAQAVIPVLQARGVLPGGVGGMLPALGSEGPFDDAPLAEVDLASSDAKPVPEPSSAPPAPEAARRAYPGWDGNGAPPLPASVAAQDIGVTPAAKAQLKASYGDVWDGEGAPPLPASAHSDGNGASVDELSLPVEADGEALTADV